MLLPICFDDTRFKTSSTMIKKTNDISNKVALWIFLLPMILAILFIISAFDYMIYNYIDESYLDGILFHKAIYLIVILSSLIAGWYYYTKFKKGEFGGNSFSDTLRYIFDFLIIGFICGFIIFFPIRGTILFTNRVVGHQREIHIHGTVQEFRYTKSRYERANRLFILDYQFDRTIGLRVRNDSVYKTGELIDLDMKEGCLGILYKK